MLRIETTPTTRRIPDDDRRREKKEPHNSLQQHPESQSLGNRHQQQKEEELCFRNVVASIKLQPTHYQRHRHRRRQPRTAMTGATTTTRRVATAAALLLWVVHCAFLSSPPLLVVVVGAQGTPNNSTTAATTATTTTETPTPSPLIIPTTTTTEEPVLPPFFEDTLEPTATPVAAPLAPTRRPTTKSPTPAPTAEKVGETEAPSTIAPSTLEPSSAEPTPQPPVTTTTRAPTRAPVQRPTTTTTTTTTETPETTTTDAPSATPPLNVQSDSIDIVLLLTGVTNPNNGSPDTQIRLDLESATLTHIQTQLQRNAYTNPPVSELTVTQVQVTDQEEISMIRNNDNRNIRLRRNLQTADTDTDAVAWRVEFRVDIAFQIAATTTVVVDDATTAAWIAGCFDTDVKLRSYRLRLSSTNDPWLGNLEAVRVESLDGINVNGEGPTVPTSTPPTTPSDNDGVIPPIQNPDNGDANNNNGGGFSTLWIIVAAVGGSVLILFVCAVLITVSRRPDKSSPAKQKNPATSKLPISKPKKRQHGTTSTDEDGRAAADDVEDPSAAGMKMGIAAEINVDGQDDVSTLGDPVFGTGFRATPHSALGGNDGDDESGDILSAQIDDDDDYDYGRSSFLGDENSDLMHMPTSSRDDDESYRFSEMSDLSKSALPSSPVPLQGKHGGNNNNPNGNAIVRNNKTDLYTTADDASFNEQYLDSDGTNEFDDVVDNGKNGRAVAAAHKKIAVTVPPGKLGMVIDTPNGSPPMVHAIKVDSILKNSGVQEGDFLVSVNGQAVSHMSAVQVSKLICQYANKERALVFARTNRGRLDSADLVLEEGAC